MATKEKPLPTFFQIYDEWRAADLSARSMEDFVSAGSLLALDGQGEPPTTAEQDEAHELRRLANELLESAMADMKKAQRQ
jgi:hypothetical protein